MKCFLDDQFRNGRRSPARSINEQGSQTDGPHPTGGDPFENYAYGQNEERLPLIDAQLQHQSVEKLAEISGQMLQDGFEVNTYMQVGGLEDIDGLYRGEKDAGVKSVDIDIGDNGADSTIKYESLENAVRNLSQMSIDQQATGADACGPSQESMLPELASLDIERQVSSNISIPRQPADINSSIPNDDSQSISSPLKNEQIYSSFRQKRLSHLDERRDNPQQENSSSPGNRRSSPDSRRRLKDPAQPREPVTDHQAAQSTYTREGFDKLGSKVPMINNRSMKNGPPDPHDHQQVDKTQPNLDGVLRTISLQDSKRQEGAQASTLTRFSNVKPQNSQYGKFQHVPQNNTERTPLLEAAAGSNGLAGQNNLIELQMFNTSLEQTPHGFRIEHTAQSPATDHMHSSHMQHFGNR